MSKVTFSPEECEAIGAEYELGYTSVQLAEKWNSTFPTVLKAIKRSGRVPRRSGRRAMGTTWNSGGYIATSVSPLDPIGMKMVEGKRVRTILQHRLVVAHHLGRPLQTYEYVHHKNGNKTDNRIENLEIWITSQPKGQRIPDLIEWAKWILETYES